MPSSLIHRFAGVLIAAVALTGCASTSQPAGAQTGTAPLVQDDVNDPLEPFNRGMFWVNEVLDKVLLRPAAEVYRAVLPDPVQTGVLNVLRNLRSPLDLTNQVLQGDWDGAGNVVKRFVINTTVGVGGLIDVAAGEGIPYQYESFEQTLAVWGVPEGPYLFLPIIGASSLRDGPALFAETWVDPVSRGFTNNDAEWVNYSRIGLVILDTRAGYIEVIDDLRTNSFDYYAAFRSLYRQRRNGWIRDGAPDPDQFQDIPDAAN
jgi:phospholipid-binding lipoprotein MlaA